MTTENHYRWDFIGLSTDTKPTAETSEKVVNGSTYYCSDTSKLYVYCNGTWYERKPLGGGGGGGGTSDFNDLSNRPKYKGSDMTGSTNIPEVKTYTAGSNVAISDQNVISATDTTYSAFTGTDGTAAGVAGLVPAPATTDAGKFLKADGTWDTAGGDGDAVKTLTSADFNWNLTLNSATEPYDCVALWLLEPGIYQKTVSSGLPVADHANPGGIETLGMGTYIVATESVNPDTKQILYTTTNSSRNWYQQLVTVSNGTSSGTRQFIMDNNVVQAPGSSTTNVMSQNAVTSMVFADPATATKVSIGNANAGTSAVSIGQSAYGAGEYSVALGYQANTYTGSGAVALGQAARARSSKAIAIGYMANSEEDGGASSVAVGSSTQAGNEAVSIGDGAGSGEANTVAIGRNAKAQGRGSVAIGDGSVMPSGYVRGTVSFYTNAIGYGYNGSSNYRLLTGLYDPQSAHDAATKGYVDPTTDSSAPTTATVGRLGQIQIDTANADAYMCVAVDDVTPAYTWKKITA